MEDAKSGSPLVQGLLFVLLPVVLGVPLLAVSFTGPQPGPSGFTVVILVLSAISEVLGLQRLQVVSKAGPPSHKVIAYLFALLGTFLLICFGVASISGGAMVVLRNYSDGFELRFDR